MKAFLLLATSAALLTGCDGDATGLANMVHVRVDSIVAAPPAAIVHFSFVNLGSEAVQVGACGDRVTPIVDRRTSGEWVDFYHGGFCIAIYPMILEIGPGESVAGDVVIDEIGVYRIRGRVQDEDGDVALTPTSDVFMVDLEFPSIVP